MKNIRDKVMLSILILIFALSTIVCVLGVMSDLRLIGEGRRPNTRCTCPVR